MKDLISRNNYKQINERLIVYSKEYIFLNFERHGHFPNKIFECYRKSKANCAPKLTEKKPRIQLVPVLLPNKYRHSTVFYAMAVSIGIAKRKILNILLRY